VSGFIGQVRALPANAFVRSSPDGTYADGDDSTWISVDWPSLTRTEMVLGRRVNLIDTGPPAHPAPEATRSGGPAHTAADAGRAGEPPTLLFLHGLGGLWQNWLLNIPAFMDRFRVLAPDLPGFGRSEMPSGRISIQGFARVIDALCDRLGVEAPVVVGNSMGGFIGAELALAFPTRVRRLVLVSAAGISAENMWREPVLAVGRLMAIGAARTGVKSLPVVGRPRLRRAALQLVVRYPEKLSVPLATELVVGAGTPGFVGGLDAVLGYSFRERLPEIEIPVLIAWGRNDVLIPVQDAFEFQRLIGDNARVEVFEDTGHLPMLERPTRFNTLLANFINPT
jgi:pimeloyl-ACP methyl ester carboxylesterase